MRRTDRAAGARPGPTSLLSPVPPPDRPPVAASRRSESDREPKHHGDELLAARPRGVASWPWPGQCHRPAPAAQGGATGHTGEPDPPPRPHRRHEESQDGPIRSPPYNRRPAGMAQPRPQLRLHGKPEPTPQLAELVARMASRDEAALSALYETCGPRVFGLAIRIVGDRHTAEEVTVDAFAQAWDRAPGYEPSKGTVLSWLLNMTRSRALDRRRRLGAKTPWSDVQVADLAAAMLAPDSSPEEVTHAAERAQRVRAAAAALPRGQREAIAAAFFAGMSHVEIATALAVPLGTIKSRIRDGMLALKRALSSTLEEAR